jgi:hypothetical protein
MGGGLMQLVAYGAQDVYLTGTPSVTFFKNKIAKHSAFATEPKEVTIAGAGNGYFGRSVMIDIARNGDLAGEIWLNATLCLDTSKVASSQEFRTAWHNNPGYRMIEQARFEIGGQQMDRIFGDWMIIWHELSKEEEQGTGWDNCIGNSPANQEFAWTKGGLSKTREIEVYVPLSFYFNRYRSLACPLIALQYHEVKLHIDFAKQETMYAIDEKGVTAAGAATTLSGVEAKIDNCRCVVFYYFLQNDERTKFAQDAYEALITQVQNPNGISGVDICGGNNNIPLDLNHPVKMLAWTVNYNKYAVGSSDRFLGTDRVSATKNFVFRYLISQLNASDVEGRIAWVSEQTTGKIYASKVEDGGVSAGSTGADVSAITTVDAAWSKQVAAVAAGARYSADPVADTATVLTEYQWNNLTVTTLLPIELCSMTINEIDALVTQTADGSVGPVNGLITNTSVILNNSAVNGKYIDGSGHLLKEALIKANGQDLFDKESGLFFNSVQPLSRGLNCPEDDSIYVYSWALKASEHQPTGTLNFSRLDSCKLHTVFTDSVAKTVRLYAVNYNVLRIMSGMGGLAYSN